MHPHVNIALRAARDAADAHDIRRTEPTVLIVLSSHELEKSVDDIAWLLLDACLVHERHGTVKGGHADIEVIPVSSDEFKRPAPRPAWSVLDCGRAASLGTGPCATWRVDATASTIGRAKSVNQSFRCSRPSVPGYLAFCIWRRFAV